MDVCVADERRTAHDHDEPPTGVYILLAKEADGTRRVAVAARYFNLAAAVLTSLIA